MRRPRPKAPEGPVLISGFVVEIRDVWLYVTAAHVIKDFRTAIAAGSTFNTWRLGDQTAGKSKQFKNSGIPFDFDMNRWLDIENEETGLDYAALVLHPMYVRQLEAGGVVPIGRRSWDDHVAEHDYWALVGVPTETLEHDGGSNLQAKVVLIPLEPTGTPAGAGEKVKNQFYARLKDDSRSLVHDVRGMSGGPIFALKRINNTDWGYAVIGVQSAWYPIARIVAGCPFISFGEALQVAIDEAIGKSET
jgi:hypothetical protein